MAIKSSVEYQPLEDDYLDLLEDAVNVLDEVKLHTLTARQAMDADPVDSRTLSNEIVNLAILSQRLDGRVSDAGMIARASDNHYKTVREEHKLRLVMVGVDATVAADDETVETKKVKMAAGVADSAKMKLAQKEYDLYNAAEGLREKLQYMRTSTDKTVDAIRSKISLEKADLKNS